MSVARLEIVSATGVLVSVAGVSVTCFATPRPTAASVSVAGVRSIRAMIASMTASASHTAW